MNLLLKLLYSFIIFIGANAYSLGKQYNVTLIFIVALATYIAVNINLPLLYNNILGERLKKCKRGADLLEVFLLSTYLTVAYYILGFTEILDLGFLVGSKKVLIINSIIVFLAELVIFWNGMIRVYIFSEQLGVKWRVIGAICGMIPVVNVIVLLKMLTVVEGEVRFENKKIKLNKERHDTQICKTKYPLLMVHGVFFRDYRYFNYWGRIPKELEENGAVIYYGNHQSAASVAECGAEIDARIRQIVKETGCEKVNIIAHSKGGLDCRYALSKLGTDKYVASLTTINSPHKGCEFADYLLDKIPEDMKKAMAATYNTALKKLGDENPDFMAAVTELTHESCEKRNDDLKDPEGVYCQSVGSKLTVAKGGRFPLNLTYKFVKNFDGYNDGLVGEESFPWGENYKFILAKGKRGISHGDIIDLNRENFKGFDVREFYVELVKALKDKGF